MSDIFHTHPLYAYAVTLIVVGGTLAFFILLFISAPYGRHFREGWGPTISSTAAWLLMEAPSPLCFAYVYLQSDNATKPVPLILAGMFMLHYVYRAFIYPLRVRGGQKQKPLFTILLAFTFNVCNGSTNAFAITELAPHLLDTAWMTDPRFVVGVPLFFIGYAINHQSDAILRNLRAPGETGYKIPHGGLYRWVTSPNYFGELIEWTGFALAAWTVPAAAFLYFTATNLIPRSLSHHRWYREHFEDYPTDRRALIPFVL